jgi:predicted DNA-binding protein
MPRVIRTISISPEIERELEELSKKEGKAVNRIINEAILMYLESKKAKKERKEGKREKKTETTIEPPSL